METKMLQVTYDPKVVSDDFLADLVADIEGVESVEIIDDTHAQV